MAVRFCRRGAVVLWSEGLRPTVGSPFFETIWATQARFAEHSARNTDEIYAYILGEHSKSYSASGAAKMMRRLGFAYKKPQSLPAQADAIKQAAFIADYDAPMTGLRPD